MNQELVDKLASMVAEGKGLRQSIRDAGLPEKETLIELRDKHREQFRAAKLARLDVLFELPQRDALALEILKTPVASEEPVSGR